MSTAHNSRLHHGLLSRPCGPVHSSMSRKRCLSSSNDAGDVVVADSVNAHDQLDAADRQHKRCCGTVSHPAPGELSTEQVASYLHGLSSHLDQSTVEHASRVLSAAGWQVRTPTERLGLMLQAVLPCISTLGVLVVMGGPPTQLERTVMQAYCATPTAPPCFRPHPSSVPCCPAPLPALPCRAVPCPALSQALAELNILMVSSALPEGSLHSYSCFTQQPREQLWHHYSKYAGGHGRASPQQLELLRFMLEWVLSP